MLLLSTITATAQNITSTPVNAVTLIAPASGVIDYVVTFRFTNLNAGAKIQISETQGSAVHLNTPVGDGSTALVLEVERIMTAGEGNVVLAVEDTEALSTAAAWSAAICEADLAVTANLAEVFTLIVVASNNARIPGAAITITSDIEGQLPIAMGTTDSNGQLDIPLLPGTYYRWATSGFFSFTNPQAFTVD